MLLDGTVLFILGFFQFSISSHVQASSTYLQLGMVHSQLEIRSSVLSFPELSTSIQKRSLVHTLILLLTVMSFSFTVEETSHPEKESDLGLYLCTQWDCLMGRTPAHTKRALDTKQPQRWPSWSILLNQCLSRNMPLILKMHTIKTHF